jgi:hypothetical protein
MINTFSGFLVFVFQALQIPLAPQRILCGPQELIIKKCQDIKVFFFQFYTVSTACFSTALNNLFGWIIWNFMLPQLVVVF